MIAALILMGVTLMMPNFYTSEARILPTEGKAPASLGGLSSLANTMGIAVPGGTENMTNLEILRSRWMAESLLKQEYSYTLEPGPFGLGRKSVKGTLEAYFHTKNTDAAIRSFNKVFQPQRDIKSTVIHLTMETQSPDLSQQVIHRAIVLLEFFGKNKSQTRGRAKALYAKARLSEAQDEYNEAELAFQDFMVTNRFYQQSGDPMVRLKGLRIESRLALRRQVVSTLSLSLEQAMLEEKDDVPILTIVDPGNLPQEKSRPSRSMFVILAFLLGALGATVWDRRGKFQNLLQM